MECKTCFKCGVSKPLEEFYKHSRMADGHLGKCKDCTKLDVQVNRKDKVSYYRAYDAKRGSRQSLEDMQNYRKNNPKKYAAHVAVGNAIRDGQLMKSTCEVCKNSKVVGHHDDYDKPLEVRWLCQAHHMSWHKTNGEGLNAH